MNQHSFVPDQGAGEMLGCSRNSIGQRDAQVWPAFRKRKFQPGLAPLVQQVSHPNPVEVGKPWYFPPSSAHQHRHGSLCQFTNGQERIGQVLGRGQESFDLAGVALGNHPAGLDAGQRQHL